MDAGAYLFVISSVASHATARLNQAVQTKLTGGINGYNPRAGANLRLPPRVANMPRHQNW